VETSLSVRLTATALLSSRSKSIDLFAVEAKRTSWSLAAKDLEGVAEVGIEGLGVLAVWGRHGFVVVRVLDHGLVSKEVIREKKKMARCMQHCGKWE